MNCPLVAAAGKIRQFFLQNHHFANKTIQTNKTIQNYTKSVQFYFTGTLSRCLARLEEEQEDANNCQARQALTRVVASAYGLDFRVANQFSTVQALWESLKMMFQTGFPQPVPDSEWKRNTAKVRRRNLKNLKKFVIT